MAGAIQSFLSGSAGLGVLAQLITCLVLEVLDGLAGFSLRSLASSLIFSPRSLALSATLCSISLILSPVLSTALPTRARLPSPCRRAWWLLRGSFRRPSRRRNRWRSRRSRAWFPRRHARFSRPVSRRRDSIAAPVFSRPWAAFSAPVSTCSLLQPQRTKASEAARSEVSFLMKSHGRHLLA